MRALTEAAFLDMVIRLARLKKWLVFHARPARTARGWRTPVSGDGKGFPDLFLIRPAAGEILFVELKSGRGRLTPEQEAWLEALRECGLPVRVWTPKDWDEITETLS